MLDIAALNDSGNYMYHPM